MINPEENTPDESLEKIERKVTVPSSFLDELINQSASYFPGEDFVIED